MSQVKRLYNSLVESGELTTLYLSMTGDWSKDKKSFTRQYNENEELINLSSIDLDDGEEFTEDL